LGGKKKKKNTRRPLGGRSEDMLRGVPEAKSVDRSRVATGKGMPRFPGVKYETTREKGESSLSGRGRGKKTGEHH